MDLKEARYIISIYKHKSITKAAEELFISQPSLSKYLQSMERCLGIPLFNRIGNEFVPTPFGERYIDYADKILMLGNEWNKEYNELIQQKTGSLTIAIPLMRSSCVIPKTLPTFLKKYPEVKVSLKEDTHTICEKLFLSENNIDFAIYNPSTLSPLLEYIELGNEELVLVTQKNHPIGKKAFKENWSDLPWMNLSLCENLPFILHFPEQNTGRIALQLFKEYEIEPNVLLNTRSTEVAISLACAGSGFVFAPETYVKKMAQTYPVDYYSIGKNSKTTVTLMAAYRKGKFLPAYAKYYIQLVKDFMDNLM